MSIHQKLMDKLRYHKAMLMSYWDMGAEQGKAMRKSHEEKIKKVVKRDGEGKK